MNSRGAQKVLQDYIVRSAEKSRGNIAGIIRFSASRQADLNIADSLSLPVRPSEEAVQDSSGNTFFRFGYSAFGGGHILK